ncbi:tetratricopeptide repeat-containing diguanylate cyclase [Dyella nitratireducens]|uniref:diguanylate cyclase n=1 Tax=Dyella nitratireducens TaxID=1849580 RepID=A0ABQ1GK03_9GAMM|nr:GGDEF domain-containing protein [Dyella nitratireducens]GGA44926.1 GGDEF domain-containing protein [Dyella nitratireducens]GLQ41251.1 GGDEF domain-containing protein [Dyella nitratireducens]
MHWAGNNRRKHCTGIFLLLIVFAGVAIAAAPAPSDVSQLLTRAENIKTSDYANFLKLLQELESRTSELSEPQKWQLRFMEGWQATYSGQDEKAKLLLEAVAKQAPDSSLRTRATATLINVLGVGHHYEEAFEYLDRALDNLPQVTDKQARFPLLGEASQLLVEAGQYDLATGYANQIVTEFPTGRYGCIGRMLKLHAELRGGQTNISNDVFQDAINRCLEVKEKLAADTIRRDMAILAMQQNKLDDALSLLQVNYQEVKGLDYPDLTSEYNVLLAQTYWKKDNIALAQKYAMTTVDIASKSDLIEPLITAYQLLYQIERQYGNLRDALAYHEKYVAADKEHLDDIREKALAYQIVKQEVEAKKIELGTLNKQNQILQLQQALDRKAVVTSRLYIALLLTVLASIAFWLYRLKRSQLRFMRLARRDGLTGIFNRQHFVEEAEQILRYVAKSLRGACLILIDLDHFKDINDTHGHVVGDAVLKRAVAVCQCHLNSCDVFGRLGGEEFGILLPECTVIQALERAERIRLSIQQVDDSEDVPLTASFGIAATAHYGYDLRRLLVAADSALYRAKNDGRNRVVVSMDDHAPRTAPSTGNSKHADTSPYANSTE